MCERCLLSLTRSNLTSGVDLQQPLLPKGHRDGRQILDGGSQHDLEPINGSRTSSLLGQRHTEPSFPGYFRGRKESPNG